MALHTDADAMVVVTKSLNELVSMLNNGTSNILGNDKLEKQDGEDLAFLSFFS